MDIEVKTGNVEEVAGELAAVALFESKKMPTRPSSLRRINGALHGVVESLFEDKEFTGKKGQITILRTHGRMKAKRIMLIGLGEKKKFNVDLLRKTVGSVALKAQDMNLSEIAMELPEEILSTPVDRLAEALVTGARLSLYRFEKYLAEKDKKPTLKHTTIVCTKRNIQKVKKSAERVSIIAQAVNLSRDIANDSGGDVTPKSIGVLAQKIAKKHGFKCQVFDEKAIKKLKMGGLLNVGRGSEHPPRFVVMECGSAKYPTVALIGKGITFDTGGISLKPSKDMDQMKYDKSGAGTILATMEAAAKLKLPVHLIGIMPLAENVPSAKSYKPGEVIYMMSGKTVEVINTDAEGRLILADALTYAQRYKPKYIVDIATLTGACVIALGIHSAGLLGNDKVLIRKLKEAGDTVGERIWELPLFDEYAEQMKSGIADLRNVGGREGGCITASAFLGKFAEGSRWAHIDIAGTAWSKEDKGYLRKGATGFGVRLFLEFLSLVK